MAEIVGLIALIAGVSTAGIQIATLLCSSIRFVKGLEDEIKNVAREVETLSSVFEEISTTLQLGNEESSSSTTKFNISRRAILSISDLVQDSQSLYEKIGDAVSHQSKLKGQAKWIFRREEVEIWSARLSKNISLVTLMMTTLLWAEKRRNQFSIPKSSEEPIVAPAINSLSNDQTTHAIINAENPEAPSEIPAVIQKQVGETVLCMVNLAKLEEAYNEGAIKVQFPTGEDLEPRHYVYQPRYGGTMRRENPERESLWFSERVNIGDADTLAERSSLMTASKDDASDNDLDVGGEHNQADQATELADRLVQDWTNLTKIEDTETWKVASDEATADAAEQQPPADDDASNADIQKPKIEASDLRALYLSQRALVNPRYGARTTSTSDMSFAEEEKRRSGDSSKAASHAWTEMAQVSAVTEKGQSIHPRLIKHRALVIESYITHIRVLEDAAFLASPPPPSSIAENKKSRCLVIAVRKSGHVRMHKARENANGTFSIGKTWRLDDLIAIQVYGNIWPLTRLELQQKEWASDEGFLLTFGKPYYWQALSTKERDFFLTALIMVYRKYTGGKYTSGKVTGGKVPELNGFSDAERAIMIDSRLSSRRLGLRLTTGTGFWGPS